MLHVLAQLVPARMLGMAWLEWAFVESNRRVSEFRVNERAFTALTGSRHFASRPCACSASIADSRTRSLILYDEMEYVVCSILLSD